MKENSAKIQKKLADSGAILTGGGTLAVQVEVHDGESPVEKLQTERARILGAIAAKDLDSVSYSQLVESLTRITHDIQLLAGKPTEITREEQLLAEENDLNNRITDLEARIGRAEGQGAETGHAESEVSERQPGEAVHTERED